MSNETVADLSPHVDASSSASSNETAASSAGMIMTDKERRRQCRLKSILAAENVDKKALADFVWGGVDGRSRSEAWQLLLGYRPVARLRQDSTLERKRRDYSALRRDIYDVPPENLQSCAASIEAGLLTQIRKDLPRTRLNTGGLTGNLQSVIEDERIRALMERVLFVWAVKQPAAGYVQGINDVLLPLLLVFLADSAGISSVEHLDTNAVDSLAPERLDQVEADCYWCLSKLLSSFAEYYIDGQPGVQRAVALIKGVLSRVDADLVAHLEQEGVDVVHAAYRWIGCLMVRELPVPLCLRLWDTCIAESTLTSAGFASFLVYFIVCFVTYFSALLRATSFDGIMAFLQHSPTENLGVADVDILLGEAYVLQSMFTNAPGHLGSTG